MSMMMNGQKAAPEAKVAAAVDQSTEDTLRSGVTHHAAAGGRVVSRREELLRVILRLLSLIASVMAMSFMVTGRQNGVVSIYGFQLAVHSKWSYSYAFEYLVGVTAAAAAHSLLQLLLNGARLLTKAPVISSRKQAWLIFAMDQIFAYAMMSAGSAAAGVTNLNRTGIKHTVLPNLCKAVPSFCDHVAVSITFTLVGCLLLTASALLDVIWITKC